MTKKKIDEMLTQCKKLLATYIGIMGTTASMILSYALHQSIGWMLLHGCFGWMYVIYYWFVY